MPEIQIVFSRKIPGKELIETWARVRVKSSGDRVYSYHLGMKTILDLVATPEYPGTAGVFVTKYLESPGQYDNYASFWVWTDTATHESTEGSVWLNIHAIGQ